MYVDFRLQNLSCIGFFQLPYEYLTPLQAAVGVVQKVYYTSSFILSIVNLHLPISL